MRKIAAKWVPLDRNVVQQCTRYETCRINLERFHREGDMLNRIIAIVETWARAYEPEVKLQSPPNGIIQSH